MAELLYRLGRAAARRAWITIGAWVALLILAGVSFAAGSGTLTSNFDIPNTASSKVIDELSDTLPDFAGASGTVVFHTADGSAFTREQQERISALVAEADGIKGVAQVVDPFETERQRADQERKLTDGKRQIKDGRARLDDGQSQLDAGAKQLADAQARLDAARKQMKAAGAPAQRLAALDAQQKLLDEQKATLAKQQKKIDDSRAELKGNDEKLALGERLLTHASKIRMVSEDGSAARVTIAFTEPRMELAPETKDGVIDHFTAKPIDGVEADFSTDIAQGVPQIIGVGEAVGVVIAAVVLLVMLGSVVAASFPIVTALVGVATGVLAALAFSGMVQMASVTPVLGVMLGLAVGIDYSLFIVNRHRKQLLQGVGVHESIGLANGTAGNAVVFAGSTVIVALLALNITGVPFLGLMGTVGAACVLIAVLVAITLTPALLGLTGMRVLSRRNRERVSAAPAAADAAPSAVPVSKPVKPMPTWRAIVTALVSVAALLVVAIPVLSMRLGLPDGSSEPNGSTTNTAFTVTEREFGAGANGPLIVVATLPAAVPDDDLTAAEVTIADALADLDDIAAVAPAGVSGDKRVIAFQVAPSEGPNSESTEQLVRDLRTMKPISVEAVNGDASLGVAGQAAINIDISESLAEVLPLYLTIVVGLSLLIMIVVFRSFLVPLVATGGFILSLLATFGAVVAVFQWGWFAGPLGIDGVGPILSFLPVILVGILFGLAMDYQLFLASGMREAYVHGSPARLAVMQGLRAGRSVVVAAGIIMVAVFGGFVFSESIIIRSVGFGLAFGVLLDAFIVRLLLMPALMHLLGKSAWWIPKWLDRIMPNVDVEGAALERRHPLHH
ncbi:MMPL family transporter [Streptosporangium sandarakinum]|uniref:MMPL family transporter n=1 Tax=Streptosporangium sandarakinum TaxID=1260955 RepID=UPI0033B544A1